MSNSRVLPSQRPDEAIPGPRIHYWKKDSGKGLSRITTLGTSCGRWVLPSTTTENLKWVTCEDCQNIIGGKQE